MKLKGPRRTKAVLKENYVGGGFTLPNSKTYHKATVMETAGCWHKARHMDQWERTGRLEVNPHIHRQLISKIASNSMGKGQSSKQTVLVQLESRTQKNEFGPLPHSL